MKKTDIQSLLDNPDSFGAVKLPAGEFEGPFFVKKPCVILGNGTTLWRRSGTVMEILCGNVRLEKLRIEYTGTDDSCPVIISDSPDVAARDTVICGQTYGINGDSGFWGIPRVIAGGRVRPDIPIEIKLEIEAAADSEIISNIAGVGVSPKNVPKGRSVVSIITEPLSSGTVIYGEIELRSLFSRIIYLNLSADENSSYSGGETVYTAPSETPRLKITRENPNTAAPKKPDAPASPEPLGSSGRLVRGQRVSVRDILGTGEITAELLFTSADRKLDIDAYTFLLNDSGLAWSDECLVFFGNTRAANGAVRYTDDGTARAVHLNLEKIPPEVCRISIAYSIYGDDPRNNFSKVHDAKVIFRCGGSIAEYPLEGLFVETTIVAASFYRKGSIWKLSAVGQGYKSGLRPLCKSYGLNIIDN